MPRTDVTLTPAKPHNRDATCFGVMYRADLPGFGALMAHVMQPDRLIIESVDLGYNGNRTRHYEPFKIGQSNRYVHAEWMLTAPPDRDGKPTGPFWEPDWRGTTVTVPTAPTHEKLVLDLMRAIIDALPVRAFLDAAVFNMNGERRRLDKKLREAQSFAADTARQLAAVDARLLDCTVAQTQPTGEPA